MIATLSEKAKLLNLRKYWKVMIFFVLAFIGFVPLGDFSAIIRTALADAYVQVTSFVALTLIIFHNLERHERLNPAQMMQRHQKWQVVIAALAGALPGCGGAIIIITQFVLGRIGFGSLVAVLTSTMGDAAFLLIAREPQTAVLVLSLSVVVGIISGYTVEKIHGRYFLRNIRTHWPDFRTLCGQVTDYSKPVYYVWYALLVPGIALGIGNAFQIDTDHWFGPLSSFAPTQWIGFVGAMFCFGLWAYLPDKGFSMVNLAAHPACRTFVKTRNRIMLDTNFVTAYVIFAFLAFELLVAYAGLDLHAWFDVAAPLMPLIATVIGFIPGCGPQIIVTTLYLNGFIPLSAQMANAISNDGDALFPALAIAPKAAFLATLYTAVPALMVGYGFYLFGL